jgi:microcystin-dependent protein
MAVPVFTDGTAFTAAQGNSLASYTMPTGAVTAFAGATAPTNYLLCDGSAVSRTTYSELFTLISTTYGVGDGSTTFNVPNLKGRMPVGLDATQSEFDVRGETGGAKTVTLTSAEMPVHNHSQQLPNATAGGAGANPGAYFSTNWTNATPNSTGPSSTTTANAGSGGAHNNLQPYIVLNYIIKT